MRQRTFRLQMLHKMPKQPRILPMHRILLLRLKMILLIITLLKNPLDNLPIRRLLLNQFPIHTHDLEKIAFIAFIVFIDFIAFIVFYID